MKKVVIINKDPLTTKIEKNFMIDQYKEKGIDIEYWCVRNILYKSFKYTLNDEITTMYLKEINDIQELLEKINDIHDIKNTAFIIEIPIILESLCIYKVLNQLKLNLFTYEMYSAAVLDTYKRIETTTKLERLKRISNIKELYQKFRFKFNCKYARYIYRKRYNIDNIVTRFCCTDLGENKNIVYINNFDYEEYYNNKEECLINYRYWLFIDQYIPYHPDYKINNSKTIDAATYYYKLEQFFECIQKTYGVKVIIAEHPKANYDKNKHFVNFKRIKGKTCTLVKYADYVLLHDSLSVSFPILYGKPIVHIYTNEFNDIYITMDRIKTLSNILGSRIFNIDTDNIQDLEYKNIDINYKKYNFYKYKYLTSKETEDKKNIDIIVNEFNKIVFSKKREDFNCE